jgi:hypothetical protein
MLQAMVLGREPSPMELFVEMYVGFQTFFFLRYYFLEVDIFIFFYF